MGHEFARPVVAAAVALVLVAAGCSGGDGAEELPAVLDNARALVTTATTATTRPATEPGEAVAEAESSPVTVVEELPAPDPSIFEGANRVVNLWVGADGETTEIDVWGRRTFTNGPVLLAEAIGFGESSDYFAAPPTHSVVIVGAGAGPDGDELSGMRKAADGEQATTFFSNDDDLGAVWAPLYWEHGAPDAPDPPEAGAGLVVLRSANTTAYTDALTASIGGDAFYVGDGSAECRPQRIEEDGFQASVVGGTQAVVLELAPGAHDLSLHPWFSPDECNQPSALTLTVDVAAGETTLAVIFSRDGSSIETLVLPVPVPGAGGS